MKSSVELCLRLLVVGFHIPHIKTSSHTDLYLIKCTGISGEFAAVSAVLS